MWIDTPNTPPTTHKLKSVRQQNWHHISTRIPNFKLKKEQLSQGKVALSSTHMERNYITTAPKL